MPIGKLIKKDDNERLKQKIAQYHYNKLAREQVEQEDSIARSNLNAFAGGVSSSLESLANRAIGRDQEADTINRVNSAYQGAVRARDKELEEMTGIPEWVFSGAAGAAQSGAKALGAMPGGMPGMAAVFAADSANQAITTGRDAGLKGYNLAEYAALQGTAEGGIMLAANALGMPGAEGLIAKIGSKPARDAVAGGIGGALKRFGAAALQELPEELLTGAVQSAIDAASVDPDAMSAESLGEMVRDTVTQTLFMTLGMSGISEASRIYENRANKLDRSKTIAGQSGQVEDAPQGQFPLDMQIKAIDAIMSDGKPREPREILNELAAAGHDPSVVGPAVKAVVDKTRGGQGYEFTEDGKLRRSEQPTAEPEQPAADPVQEATEPDQDAVQSEAPPAATPELESEPESAPVSEEAAELHQMPPEQVENVWRQYFPDDKFAPSKSEMIEQIESARAGGSQPQAAAPAVDTVTSEPEPSPAPREAVEPPAEVRDEAQQPVEEVQEVSHAPEAIEPEPPKQAKPQRLGDSKPKPAEPAPVQLTQPADAPLVGDTIQAEPKPADTSSEWVGAVEANPDVSPRGLSKRLTEQQPEVRHKDGRVGKVTHKSPIPGRVSITFEGDSKPTPVSVEMVEIRNPSYVAPQAVEPAPVVEQPAEVEAATEPVAESQPAADPVRRVYDVARQLAKPPGRVRIADVREALSDIPADQVTSILQQGEKDGWLVLNRLDNPLEIEQRDRDAQLTTGLGDPRHILHVTGELPAVAPTPAADPEPAAEPVAEKPAADPAPAKPKPKKLGSSKPSAKPAEPRRMTNEGRAEDGGPIMPGDTFFTSSGRTTSAYPKYSTKRHTAADAKKADLWLLDNAITEAESRGDDFNATGFRGERDSLEKGKGGLPPASVAAAQEYLFGEQPPVVPKLLKPLSGATESKPAAEARNYGTPEEIDAVEVGKAVGDELLSGKRYASITEARNTVSSLVGGAVKPGTPQAKVADEAIEQGVVRAAREIVKKSHGDDAGTYSALVDLYERQPRLGVRTSTSMKDQAYSTPAPLAWLGSVMADIKPEHVTVDTSAGNGMLLIAADTKNAHANELNPARVKSLQGQGLNVTEGDALAFKPGAKVDRVAINPPFGKVPDGGLRHKTFNVDGYKTDQVDHAITLKSLAELPADGKAFVIIGSKGFEKRAPKPDMQRASAYSAQKGFYDRVWDNYNVTDHFTVHGDLYSKQGAEFPVDVIVINGRGASSRPKPYNFLAGGLPEVFTSWEDLGNAKLKRPENVVVAGATPDADPSPTGGAVDQLADVPGEDEGKGGGTKRLGGGSKRPSRSPRAESKRPAGRPGSAGADGESARGDGGSVSDERDGDGGTRRASAPVADGVDGRSDGDDSGLDPALLEAAQAVWMEETGGKPQGKGVKADAPKKSFGKPQTKIQKKAADAKAKGRASRQAAYDAFDNSKLTSGLDPDLVRVTVRAAIDTVNEGIWTFAEFIERIHSEAPHVLTPKHAQYWEAAWTIAQRNDTTGKVQPVGKVADVLEKLEPSKPEVAADQPQDQETDLQVAYSKRSAAGGVGTLVPKSHAGAVADAMDAIEQRYGDFDSFVAKELGYSKGDLGRYFSAEQVDALAMAIAGHKDGKAFILGDQTGVGKGRVAAAMMVYAKRQGLAPVFITEKPSLFGDMVRDLSDIGQNTEGKRFNFLPINSLGKSGDTDTTLTLPDGRVITQSRKKADERLADAVKSVKQDGRIVAEAQGSGRKKNPAIEYDAIFATYSQFAPLGFKLYDRQQFVESMKDKAFFILDESHNAGGSESSRKVENEAGEAKPTRASIIRDALSGAGGSMFLSATFAKRPQTMDLYANTGMMAAFESPEKFRTAIETGGVPMQQVVSEMLVEKGAYLRRERSFAGVEVNPKVVDVGLDRADEIAAVFRAVREFDKAKQEAVKAMQAEIVSGGGTMMRDSAIGGPGITSTEFSSILWNVTDQMLFALKADQAADEAIAAWKDGDSPFIAVDNTMESALDHFLEGSGHSVGDEIDFSFKNVVMRYLERSREVLYKEDRSNKDEKGQRIRLTDAQLGPLALRLYDEAKQMIEDADISDLPASPIDWIRKRMTDAGMKVAEVTGRTFTVEYRDGQPPVLSKKDKAEAGEAGKIRTINGFNDGSIDVVIANRSGATGLSAHASKLFKNQKRRNMIVAQAAKNIDEFMQMLGRVHRTGQVVAPTYTILSGNAPAELRLTSVLSKKLSSLNANVTADSKGGLDVGVPDIMNEVGDFAVAQYLSENRKLDKELGNLISVSAEGDFRFTPGLARKATGYMAIQPVKVQQDFWDSVTAVYNAEIERLNSINANPLVAQTLDLRARTKERVEIFAGDPGSSDPFAQPAYAEVVTANVIGEPPGEAEVLAKLSESFGEDIRSLDDLGPVYRRQRAWAEGIGGVLNEARDGSEESALKRIVDPEKRIEAKNKVREDYNALRRKLSDFAPGTHVTVKEMGDEFVGVVTRILPPKKAPSLAMSRWQVEFAINTAGGIRRLPMTQLESEAKKISVRPAPEQDTAGAIRQISEVGAGTETRIIGTGNVLAAYGSLVSEGSPGSIVFFTDSEGAQRRGVLMRKSFNLDKWKEALPVTFDTAEQVIAFVEEGGQANSPKFEVQIATAGGNLVLRAPRSRQKARGITTNPELMDAMGGEFILMPGGKAFEAVVSDRGRWAKTIDTIMDIYPLSTGMLKDSARAVKERLPKPEPKSAEVKPEKKPEPPKEKPQPEPLNGNPGEFDKVFRFGSRKKKLGGPRRKVDRAAILRTFPGAIVKPSRSGGWHVEVGDSYFDIEMVDNIDVDFAEVERRIGRSLPKSMRDSLAAAGAYSMKLQDGTVHNGLGVIKLDRELADDGVLRHEALHLARKTGMIGRAEWRALVKEYAKGERSPAVQEELIAQAMESEPRIEALRHRIGQFLHRMLRMFGLTSYNAQDVHDILRSSGFWRREGKRPDPNTISYELRSRDPKFAALKRNLANPATDEVARKAVRDIDKWMEEQGYPGIATHAEADAAAEAMLKADYDGVRRTILRKGREGGQLSDEETMAAKKIINREASKAFGSGDLNAIEDATALIEAYRRTGTEQARGLSARRDPIESPAERFARTLSEAILEPPLKEKRRREKARENGNHDLADAINKKWAQKFERLKRRLKDLGVDLDDLHSAGYSKRRASKVLMAVARAKATGWDVAFEYWRNSILSAPSTHSANMIGNFAHAGWSMTAERLLEATVNTLVRNPDAATMGELKHFYAGFLPGLSRGARNFFATWRSEQSELAQQLGMEDPGKLDFTGHAIGGPIGRVVRTPQRLLLAADDLAKTLFSEMQAGAQAYRIAKREGLKGDKIRERIAELTADVESEAWQQAIKFSAEMAFQQEGSETSQAVKNIALGARRKIKPLYFILPFVTTPVNIFEVALRKSPLGSAYMPVKMWKNYRDGNRITDGVPKLVAEQIIAMGLIYALLGNDEDEPWITGGEQAADPESREVSYRTIPPNAINFARMAEAFTGSDMGFDDAWVSYSRLEPFATGLGVTTDILNAIRSGDTDRMVGTPMKSLLNQTRDKTFLSGVSDIFDVLSARDPGGEVAKWAGNFAVSWVPNAVRAVGRESSETFAERRVWGKGEEWTERMLRRIGQKTEMGLIPDEPIYDVWGRPALRQEHPASDFLYRLMVPIKVADDKTFVADRLIQNYNNQNPNKQRFPLRPQPYYQVGGETKYMTDSQYSEYVRLSGESAVKALERFGLDPDNPTIEQVNVVGDVVADTRAEVRKRLVKAWESGEGDPPEPSTIARVVVADMIGKARELTTPYTTQSGDLRTGRGQPVRPKTARWTDPQGWEDYESRAARFRERQAQARETLRLLRRGSSSD